MLVAYLTAPSAIWKQVFFADPVGTMISLLMTDLRSSLEGSSII